MQWSKQCYVNNEIGDWGQGQGSHKRPVLGVIALSCSGSRREKGHLSWQGRCQ